MDGDVGRDMNILGELVVGANDRVEFLSQSRKAGNIQEGFCPLEKARELRCSKALLIEV